MSADEQMQKRMEKKIAVKMLNEAMKLLMGEVMAKLMALAKVHEVVVSLDKPAEAMLTLIPIMKEALSATEACLRKGETK
jgi:hypothetical protein